MTRTFQHLATMAIGLALMILTATVAVADDLDLEWSTVDCGGATFSTGGTLELGGSIAQHDASAELTGGTLSITGGFWPAIAADFTCLADIAGHDGVVNIDDMLFVITHWGEAGGPGDIAPNGGDGIVNIDDLLFVINAWGSCS